MYMHIEHALVHTYAFPLSHILPLTYSLTVSYISPATNVDSEAVLIRVSTSQLTHLIIHSHIHPPTDLLTLSLILRL